MSEIYEDGEEGEDVTFEETTTRRSGKADPDKPVTNAGDIPLFIDADKRGINTAQYLKITKLDKPGAGYKGQMPLSSTMETIAGLHGNGTFNIHLCNGDHKVLRKMENVQISLSDDAITQATSNGSGKNSAADQHLAFLLKDKTTTDKAALDRERERNREHSEQVTTQAKQFTDMVTTTTESAAERDREHMKGVNEGQQQFFASMQAQQAQMFQQTMGMMVLSHNQTMEAMRASYERDKDQNSPSMLMEILMKGINIGKEFENDDDPWIKALDKGGDMLGGLIELQKGSAKTTVTSTTTKRPEKENPSKPPKETKEPLLTKKELIGAIKLKKMLRERGIDLEDQLEQASKHYRDIPESELYSEGETPDDAPEGKSDDTPNEESKET